MIKWSHKWRVRQKHNLCGGDRWQKKPGCNNGGFKTKRTEFDNKIQMALKHRVMDDGRKTTAFIKHEQKGTWITEMNKNCPKGESVGTSGRRKAEEARCFITGGGFELFCSDTRKQRVTGSCLTRQWSKQQISGENRRSAKLKVSDARPEKCISVCVNTRRTRIVSLTFYSYIINMFQWVSSKLLKHSGEFHHYHEHTCLF